MQFSSQVINGERSSISQRKKTGETSLNSGAANGERHDRRRDPIHAAAFAAWMGLDRIGAQKTGITPIDRATGYAGIPASGDRAFAADGLCDEAIALSRMEMAGFFRKISVASHPCS